MKRQLVHSANILAIGYDSLSQRMEVVFRAAPRLLYTYVNVDIETYMKVMAAESKGQAFNVLIRSRPERFPYTKRKI